MPWGDNTKGQGPWGGGQPPKRPKNEQPDIDELLKRSREKFDQYFKGGGGNGAGGGAGGFSGKSILVVLLIAFFVWLSTGLYQVGPDQEAVVLRFGAYHRSAGEGLHYHLPRPFEQVIKVPITQINKLEVGVRTGAGSSVGAGQSARVLEESLMLTGDENIVDVDFEVQWRIGNAADYLFNVKNPDSTIKSVAESAMREVIGRTPIADALTEGRAKVQQEAKEIIQDLLNTYQAGVLIARVNLREVQPPGPVIDAFRDVQNAKTEKQSLINKAVAYRNDIIPRARGEAEKILQQSQAYQEEVVAVAQGQAERFEQIYEEYRQAKSITRKRLYLETMEDIFQDMDKIILDEQAGAVPYLPLNELKKRNQ